MGNVFWFMQGWYLTTMHGLASEIFLQSVYSLQMWTKLLLILSLTHFTFQPLDVPLWPGLWWVQRSQNDSFKVEIYCSNRHVLQSILSQFSKLLHDMLDLESSQMHIDSILLFSPGFIECHYKGGSILSSAQCNSSENYRLFPNSYIHYATIQHDYLCYHGIFAVLSAGKSRVWKGIQWKFMLLRKENRPFFLLMPPAKPRGGNGRVWRFWLLSRMACTVQGGRFCQQVHGSLSSKPLDWLEVYLAQYQFKLILINVSSCYSRGLWQVLHSLLYIEYIISQSHSLFNCITYRSVWHPLHSQDQY